MNASPRTGTPTPIAAAICDRDGVLVDSEPLLFEAERILLAELGAGLTEEIKRPFIGRAPGRRRATDSEQLIGWVRDQY